MICVCENDKNGGNNGEKDMAKLASLEYPIHRKDKTLQAIKEVELIKKGELPRKSARDFLRESRNE